MESINYKYGEHKEDILVIPKVVVDMQKEILLYIKMNFSMFV
jgi:hypothetical protein